MGKKTISYRLGDLKNVMIPLGFMGENLYTQLIIDATEVYKDNPNAIVSLAVSPPRGEKYPAVVERDGNNVIWNITASDLIYDGNGEIQFTFTDDPMVRKSYKARISVNNSITPTGTVPTPIANFLTQASEALTACHEATTAAENAASKQPKIINDYWFVWDEETKQYVTTGIKAKGDKGDPGEPGSPGDPTLLIDDTTPSSNKTFSSSKVDTELGGVKSDINNIVKVQDSTPSDPAVKIWFPATAQESIQVPTFEEHKAKADKVTNATNGNFAGLDANGNLTDSGKKASDFGTYSKPNDGIPSSDMASAVQTSLGKADTAYQKPGGGIPDTDLKERYIKDDSFRLIKEVTTVADQGYVYINTDSDGESFSLKEMIIEANILTCNNSVTGFIVPNKANNYNIGNYAWLGLYNFTSNSGDRKTIAHIQVKGGKFFGESNGDSLSQYYTTARKYTSAMAMGTQDCDPISSIGIGGIGGTVFGTGSTIKVYGR